MWQRDKEGGAAPAHPWQPRYTCTQSMTNYAPPSIFGKIRASNLLIITPSVLGWFFLGSGRHKSILSVRSIFLHHSDSFSIKVTLRTCQALFNDFLEHTQQYAHTLYFSLSEPGILCLVHCALDPDLASFSPSSPLYVTESRGRVVPPIIMTTMPRQSVECTTCLIRRFMWHLYIL